VCVCVCMQRSGEHRYINMVASLGLMVLFGILVDGFFSPFWEWRLFVLIISCMTCSFSFLLEKDALLLLCLKCSFSLVLTL
jgi:hypothetical protein